jgi:hypothetical protein
VLRLLVGGPAVDAGARRRRLAFIAAVIANLTDCPAVEYPYDAHEIGTAILVT